MALRESERKSVRFGWFGRPSGAGDLVVRYPRVPLRSTLGLLSCVPSGNSWSRQALGTLAHVCGATRAALRATVKIQDSKKRKSGYGLESGLCRRGPKRVISGLEFV